MKESLDPPRTPDEPGVPIEEEGRCNTRALDLGAVRAIHRAAQGAAFAPATVQDVAPNPVRPQVRPAVETGFKLPGSDGAAGPAKGPVPPAVPSAERHERPTLEVDYSPASRMRRDRSLRVQRTARRIVLAAVIASIGLGAWALLGGKDRAPSGPPSAEPAGSQVAAMIAASPPLPSTSDPPTSVTASRPVAPEPSAAPAAPQTTSAPAGTPAPSPRRPPPAAPAFSGKRKPPPAPTSDFPNQ